MFAKCLSLSSAVVVISSLLSLLGDVVAPSRALADEFKYFGGEIDYWNDHAPDPKPVMNRTKPPYNEAGAASGSKSGDKTPPGAAAGDRTKGGSFSGGAFPWHQYLDPKNKEFFKEGDYTPPEPFMEIVRNPSDSNLKMWFEYIGKKNELSGRLAARMQEYLGKNTAAIPAESRERVSAKIASLPRSASNAQRFRFRLYFDSHCPHCKRMFETMADLQTRGYFVEARQVDRDARAVAGLPIASEQASPSELQSKDIKSVPVLLVGDLNKKVVYRINGYQTTQQVIAALPKEDGQ